MKLSAFWRVVNKICLSIIILIAVFAPYSLITRSPAGGVTVLPNVANAQNFANEAALQDTTALPQCTDLMENFSIVGCLGQGLYWALWMPTQWLANRAGGFLDYFIFHSINSNTYRGVPFNDPDSSGTDPLTRESPKSTFIQEGWEVVRDISNILFIFALLYIAAAFVVGLSIGNVNPKKLLVYVVVMALLMNFSLFFSRIVVDAGNILARTLYNQINLVGRGLDSEELQSPDGVKSIGVLIISLANPQKMILDQTNSVVVSDSSGNNSYYFIVIVLGAAIFNIFMIYVFVSVAIYFISRTVGLYYSMIFSPFAFASLSIPKGSNIGYIGFDDWFKNLVNYSFMAPLFIFFIYLIIKFLQLGIPINSYVTGSLPSAQIFMSILIPFALVIAFLVVGRKMAKDMSGKLGEVTASVVNKTVGFATKASLAAGAVVTTGIAAGFGGVAKWAGKGLVQGTGKRKLFGREFEIKSQRLGNVMKGTGKYLQERTFDARKTKAYQAARTITGTVGGMVGDKGTLFDNAGKGVASGGYNAWKGRQKEKTKKKLEYWKETRREVSEEDAAWHDHLAKKHNAQLDEDLTRTYENEKAAEEKKIKESDQYKKLTPLQQALFMQKSMEKFDKEYDQTMKDNRWNDLLQELEQSTKYKQAKSDEEKNELKKNLKKEFDKQYKKGKVVHEVDDATGKAITGSTHLATNYRREKTAAQKNRETDRIHALEVEQRGTSGFTRQKAGKRQYVAETIKQVGTEEKKEKQLLQLTNELTNLNENMALWLNVANKNITFEQGGVTGLTFSQLDPSMPISAVIEDGVQINKNGKPYNNLNDLLSSYTPQKSTIKNTIKQINDPDLYNANAKALAEISADMQAKIELLNAEIKAATEILSTSTNAAQKRAARATIQEKSLSIAILKGKMNNLNLDKPRQINDSINRIYSS